ncbi:hypothetical protein AMTRI_Chr03g144580 [Amborella trichopoda]
METEIVVIPFHGQGHIFPCIELCNQLARLNLKTTALIPSPISSSLRLHPLVQIMETSTHSPPPPPPQWPENSPSPSFPAMLDPLESILLERVAAGKSLPTVVIVDTMMSRLLETCRKFKIPAVSFFTSGACAAAMEHALWMNSPDKVTQGQVLTLNGLPGEMALSSYELKRFFFRPPHPPPNPTSIESQRVFGNKNQAFPGWGSNPPPLPENMSLFHKEMPFDRKLPPPLPESMMSSAGKMFSGQGPLPPPPQPGGPPRWMEETQGSVVLMINTCSDLERPFLDYMADVAGKPVWGVGPLLPSSFWDWTHGEFHDSAVRATRDSSVSEEEVRHWLDNMPHGSVLYVAFGTEVGPTRTELAELAVALEETHRPFIWAIQRNAGRRMPPPPPGIAADVEELRPPPPGIAAEGVEGVDNMSILPEGFEQRVGSRGLVIHGWAPQLMILNHTATGGFLSHCGWNSMVEAVCAGVPLLAWPIRGDQHYNAKMVASWLKIGSIIMDTEMDGEISKDVILAGIERVMSAVEARRQVESIRKIFSGGFPASSRSALDDFRQLVQQLNQQE